MYNLDVTELDNFYVGEQGWLVHNGNGSGGCPVLPGDPWNPDEVAKRSAENHELYAPTKGEVFAARASALGYDRRIPPQKFPGNSHGEPVFFNGTNYISPENTAHNTTNGWKLFDRHGNRIGTLDANGNWIKK